MGLAIFPGPQVLDVLAQEQLPHADLVQTLAHEIKPHDDDGGEDQERGEIRQADQYFERQKRSLPLGCVSPSFSYDATFCNVIKEDSNAFR